MYWIRIKPLKVELAGTGLNEKDRFWYILVWMVAMGLAALSPRHETGFAQTAAFVSLAVTAAGILLAFRWNGGAAGTSFLDRFLSIGWVVNFRILLVLLGIEIVVGLLADATGYGDAWSDSHETFFPLLFIALEVYIAWSVARHVRNVRQAAEAVSAGPARQAEDQTAQRLEKFVEAVVKRARTLKTP